MERVLEERSRELILPPLEDSAPASESACPLASDAVVAPTAPPQPTSSRQRRQRRLERYEEVVARFHAGESQAAISRAMGLERKTIRRWLRRGQFPERKRPSRRPAKVNEFADYLHQRWNEGCHNASRLFREIQAKGYAGKRAMVANFVTGWRKTGKAVSPKSPYESLPSTPPFSSPDLPTR